MSLAAAAERFLGMSHDTIQQVIFQTLEGHLRSILGTLTVEEVNSDRTSFAQKLTSEAALDLERMGIGVDVLTVNNRLDETSPTQSLAQVRAGMHRLAELVSSSRAAFGVRFDPVGERITLVDDKGAMVSDERALLVVLDLIAAERRTGRVALPVTTTRVAERVSRFHDVEVDWTPTSLHGLYEATAAEDVIFAADGRGGFVVPEFSRSIDGIAAFARLIGLVARTRLELSQIDARIPAAHLLRRSMPTPWAAKGSVMRIVVEAAGDRTIDTTDGVRVVEPDGGWILVLPDPSDAVTHLWAEACDGDAVQALLDKWAAVVEQAGG